MKAFLVAATNVVAMRRRMLGQMVLIALSVGLCLTSFGIADNAKSVSTGGVLEATANRSITVERLIDRPDSPLLTDDTVRRLKALANVESVEPRTQVSFGYKDQWVPGVLLYATIVRPSLAPPVIRATRAAAFPLGPHEAVLPARADGTDLSGLLGRKITVQTITATGASAGTGSRDDVTVVGLYDPTWQLDGPGAAYVDTDTVIAWSALRAGVPADLYAHSVGYDRVTVLATSAAAVPPLLHAIQADGYAADALQQQLSQLPATLSFIDLASRALLVVLALVALVGTLTVTGALVRQRTREIGILKAVGFGNGTVFGIFLMEAMLAAAAALVTGVVLGLLGSWALGRALRANADIRAYLPDTLALPAWTTLLSVAVFTVAVTALGAARPAARAARMDPSDAMRDW